jgi:hypothetical protein
MTTTTGPRIRRASADSVCGNRNCLQMIHAGNSIVRIGGSWQHAEHAAGRRPQAGLTPSRAAGRRA